MSKISELSPASLEKLSTDLRTHYVEEQKFKKDLTHLHENSSFNSETEDGSHAKDSVRLLVKHVKLLREVQTRIENATLDTFKQDMLKLSSELEAERATTYEQLLGENKKDRGKQLDGVVLSIAEMVIEIGKTSPLRKHSKPEHIAGIKTLTLHLRELGSFDTLATIVNELADEKAKSLTVESSTKQATQLKVAARLLADLSRFSTEKRMTVMLQLSKALSSGKEWLKKQGASEDYEFDQILCTDFHPFVKARFQRLLTESGLDAIENGTSDVFSKSRVLNQRVSIDSPQLPGELLKLSSKVNDTPTQIQHHLDTACYRPNPHLQNLINHGIGHYIAASKGQVRLKRATPESLFTLEDLSKASTIDPQYFSETAPYISRHKELGAAFLNAVTIGTIQAKKNCAAEWKELLVDKESILLSFAEYGRTNGATSFRNALLAQVRAEVKSLDALDIMDMTIRPSAEVDEACALAAKWRTEALLDSKYESNPPPFDKDWDSVVSYLQESFMRDADGFELKEPGDFGEKRRAYLDRLAELDKLPKDWGKKDKQAGGSNALKEVSTSGKKGRAGGRGGNGSKTGKWI